LLAAYPRTASATSLEQLGKDAWYSGCKGNAKGEDSDEGFELHFERLFLVLGKGIGDGNGLDLRMVIWNEYFFGRILDLFYTQL
jgi:hypothetical protein